MKRKFKVGDLVRVGRAYWHYVPFGTVCRVTEEWPDGDLSVATPCHLPHGHSEQIVEGSNCRLAKQAMKKAGLK